MLHNKRGIGSWVDDDTLAKRGIANHDNWGDVKTSKRGSRIRNHGDWGDTDRQKGADRPTTAGKSKPSRGDWQTEMWDFIKKSQFQISSSNSINMMKGDAADSGASGKMAADTSSGLDAKRKAFMQNDHDDEDRNKGGEWNCPSVGCNAHNYAHRKTCFKCNIPRPKTEDQPQRSLRSSSNQQHRNIPESHSGDQRPESGRKQRAEQTPHDSSSYILYSFQRFCPLCSMQLVNAPEWDKHVFGPKHARNCREALQKITKDEFVRLYGDLPLHTGKGMSAFGNVQGSRSKQRAESGRDQRVEFGCDLRAESGRDQRAESGRDQRVESGRDQRAEFGRDQRAESGRDQRAESGRDQRAESGRDQRAEFGREQRAEFGHDQRVEFGRDQRAEFGRDQRAESGRDQRVEFGRDQRAEFGRDQRAESGRDQRAESGREQRVEFGRDQRAESGRDQRMEFGRDQRAESGRDQRVEFGRDQRVESGRDQRAVILTYRSQLKSAETQEEDEAVKVHYVTKMVEEMNISAAKKENIITNMKKYIQQNPGLKLDRLKSLTKTFVLLHNIGKDTKSASSRGDSQKSETERASNLASKTIKQMTSQSQGNFTFPKDSSGKIPGFSGAVQGQLGTSHLSLQNQNLGQIHSIMPPQQSLLGMPPLLPGTEHMMFPSGMLHPGLPGPIIRGQSIPFGAMQFSMGKPDIAQVVPVMPGSINMLRGLSQPFTQPGYQMAPGMPAGIPFTHLSMQQQQQQPSFGIMGNEMTGIVNTGKTASTGITQLASNNLSQVASISAKHIQDDHYEDHITNRAQAHAGEGFRESSRRGRESPREKEDFGHSSSRKRAYDKSLPYANPGSQERKRRTASPVRKNPRSFGREETRDKRERDEGGRDAAHRHERSREREMSARRDRSGERDSRQVTARHYRSRERDDRQKAAKKAQDMRKAKGSAAFTQSVHSLQEDPQFIREVQRLSGVDDPEVAREAVRMSLDITLDMTQKEKTPDMTEEERALVKQVQLMTGMNDPVKALEAVRMVTSNNDPVPPPDTPVSHRPHRMGQDVYKGSNSVHDERPATQHQRHEEAPLRSSHVRRQPQHGGEGHVEQSDMVREVMEMTGTNDMEMVREAVEMVHQSGEQLMNLFSHMKASQQEYMKKDPQKQGQVEHRGQRSRSPDYSRHGSHRSRSSEHRRSDDKDSRRRNF